MMQRKIFSNWPSYAACIILLVGVSIRLALIFQGWPLVDSDEATMGLMAMHILHYHETPLFLYGQSYMGTSEAFLGAMFFHFFDIGAVFLRFGTLFYYILFMIGIYLLTARLYTRNWALVTLLFLAFGSNAILTRQLVAAGGYAEILAIGIYLLLIATHLAWTANKANAFNDKKRTVLFFLWGMLAGFGLWSHLLIAPFIAMSFFILMIFCNKEMAWHVWVVMLTGVFIGAAPLIIYNLRYPQNNSLIVFMNIHTIGGHYPANLLEQLRGMFFIALPIATGAPFTCTPSDALNMKNLHCTITHAGWSLSAVFLWFIAILLTCRTIIFNLATQTQGTKKHEELVQQCGRLAFLGVAALTVIAYTLSPNAHYFPVPTARYFYVLLAVIPAVLWPFWWSLQQDKPLLVRVIGIGGLAIALSAFVLSTITIFTGYPASQAHFFNLTSNQELNIQHIEQHYDLPATKIFLQKENELLKKLDDLEIKHIISDYWSCNRFIFRSKERIICRVIDNLNTSSGFNRYQPYKKIVDNDSNASYVFEEHSVLDEEIREYYKNTSTRYDVITVGGYNIYRLSNDKLNKDKKDG